MYVLGSDVTGGLFCMFYGSLKSWPVLRISSDTNSQGWWYQFG